MRPRTLIASVATAAVLALSACTGGNGPQLPGMGPGKPAVAVQEGPAPSVTTTDASVRVDQVTRQGDKVAVALTFATAENSASLTRYGVEVRTNTGLKLENEKFPDRDIAAYSAAALTLDVPLPAGEQVTELTLRVRDDKLTVKVPVPAEDGTNAWLPAPVRQVAPDQKILRSEASQLIVDTIRSEGLVTEVAVRATGLERDLELCLDGFVGLTNQCTLTEPNGTVHPLLAGTKKADDGLRQSSVLRFLGEVNPDTSMLKLAVARGWSDTSRDTIDIALPSHADSLARVTAGDLSRPAADMPPVEVTDAKSSTTVRVTGVDVLADHVQVHVTATVAGEKTYYLDKSQRGTTALRESNGFLHPLAQGKDVSLTVKPGETLEATLVFRGSVPADVTSLDLVLPLGWDQESVTATLPIAAVDAAPDTDGATFAQLDAPQPEAPEVLATPAAADPSATAQPTAAVLLGRDMVELPLTTSSVEGAVHSTIKGQSSAPKVSSGETVDPEAEAAAQRSLKDLGAEKTPDGYVLTLPETVLFDYNKADLKSEASATITKVAELLAYYDKAQIGVLGHTDSTGDEQGNQDLSQRRAQAVADALSGGGVSSSRMTVEGFAATQPVASNADDAGRAKNRRVEIVLKENA